jgi:hypothetical protein
MVVYATFKDQWKQCGIAVSPEEIPPTVNLWNSFEFPYIQDADYLKKLCPGTQNCTTLFAESYSSAPGLCLEIPAVMEWMQRYSSLVCEMQTDYCYPKFMAAFTQIHSAAQFGNGDKTLVSPTTLSYWCSACVQKIWVKYQNVFPNLKNVQPLKNFVPALC